MDLVRKHSSEQVFLFEPGLWGVLDRPGWYCRISHSSHFLRFYQIPITWLRPISTILPLFHSFDVMISPTSLALPLKLEKCYYVVMRYTAFSRECGPALYKTCCFSTILEWSSIFFLNFSLNLTGDSDLLILFINIARLCHIGNGFLKFSLILLNSERKIYCNVM